MNNAMTPEQLAREYRDTPLGAIERLAGLPGDDDVVVLAARIELARRQAEDAKNLADEAKWIS